MGLNFIASAPSGNVEKAPAPQEYYGLLPFDGSDRHSRRLPKRERRYNKQVNAFRTTVKLFQQQFPEGGEQAITCKPIHAVAIASQYNPDTNTHDTFIHVRKTTPAAKGSPLGQGITFVVNPDSLAIVTDPELGVVPTNFSYDGPLLNLARVALEDVMKSSAPVSS